MPFGEGISRALLAVSSGVAALALIFFGFAVFDDRAAPPIVIEDPLAEATIIVAVEGAVASPGVYRLPGDARTQDALSLAGGPAPDADLGALNLARRLRDEDQVVVPRLAVAPVSSAIAPTGPRSTGAPPATGAPIRSDMVDLNTASLAELDTLPGIGPALAQRIVAYRTERGRLDSVDELANVAGISLRMVDEIRSLVTVGP